MGPKPIPLLGIEELAKSMSAFELADHFGVRVRLIYDRLSQMGIKPYRAKRDYKARSEAPANFREIAEGKMISALCSELRRGHSTIRRWLAEHDMPVISGVKQQEPPPADFGDYAPFESNAQLEERYSRSDALITRWRKVTGIPAPGRAKKTYQPVQWKHPPAAPLAPRDDSMAGRAADYLRMPRGGGWRVNRCKADGTFDPKGDHWRVGRMLLTEEAMLEMASRKGWRAFSMEIAA